MTDETKKTNTKKKENKIFAKMKKIKHIEIIIAVIFIVVLLIIFFSGSSSSFNIFGGNNKTNANSDSSDTSTYTKEIEAKLKEMVSSIKGAGSAEVMINFESTPELIIAYIENESIKSQLGEDGKYTEDKTTSKNPVILTENGNQLPLILKEIAPKVLGIMIVASGAGDTKVKLDIINAVSVLMNINPNKIAVLEKTK